MLDILHLIYNYFYSIITFITGLEIVEGLSILHILIISSLVFFAFKLFRR